MIEHNFFIINSERRQWHKSGMFICKSQFTQQTFLAMLCWSQTSPLKTFCMCFYDIGPWRFLRVGSLRKLASAYVKCIKIFFGYHKYRKVSHVLMDLGLTSFNTVTSNADFICDTIDWSHLLIAYSSDCYSGITFSQCVCVYLSVRARVFAHVCLYVYVFVLCAYAWNKRSFIHSFIHFYFTGNNFQCQSITQSVNTAPKLMFWSFLTTDVTPDFWHTDRYAPDIRRFI